MRRESTRLRRVELSQRKERRRSSREYLDAGFVPKSEGTDGPVRMSVPAAGLLGHVV